MSAEGVLSAKLLRGRVFTLLPPENVRHFLACDVGAPEPTHSQRAHPFGGHVLHSGHCSLPTLSPPVRAAWRLLTLSTDGGKGNQDPKTVRSPQLLLGGAARVHRPSTGPPASFNPPISGHHSILPEARRQKGSAHVGFTPNTGFKKEKRDSAPGFPSVCVQKRMLPAPELCRGQKRCVPAFKTRPTLNKKGDATTPKNKLAVGGNMKDLIRTGPFIQE